MARRHAHEFQCDGRGTATASNPTAENCGYYNYPMLDDTMTGNYIVVCGNCGHEHYRTIVKGVVTADRHSAKYGEAERIHVMKSASQREKRKLGAIAQFRQMEAAGLASGGGE